jgi:hypothetical protein
MIVGGGYFTRYSYGRGKGSIGRNPKTKWKKKRSTKGAFTLGVMDSSIKSPNTKLVN